MKGLSDLRIKRKFLAAKIIDIENSREAVKIPLPCQGALSVVYFLQLDFVDGDWLQRLGAIKIRKVDRQKR